MTRFGVFCLAQSVSGEYGTWDTSPRRQLFPLMGRIGRLAQSTRQLGDRSSACLFRGTTD